MSIKNVHEDHVDNVLNAVGNVIKAIISIAKCIDNAKKKEPSKKTVV